MNYSRNYSTRDADEARHEGAGDDALLQLVPIGGCKTGGLVELEGALGILAEHTV